MTKLWYDAEYFFLLRSENDYGDDLRSTWEVAEVEFNIPLNDSLFLLPETMVAIGDEGELMSREDENKASDKDYGKVSGMATS